jgi:hypothetical protein
MKATLSRRLALLEARQGNTARRIHIVVATDVIDSKRRIAELQAVGKVGSRDGFLCLTGWTRAPFTLS